MREFFKELSEKEKGKFQVINEVVASGIGSRSPHFIYYLNFEYQGKDISVKNEIGVASVGLLTCKFPNELIQPKFSIRTISHFFKVIFNKKSSFIIKTKNKNLKLFLVNNESLKKLESLTINTQFELSIFIEKNKDNYTLFTEYNILYENRKEALTFLIQFYKELIDNLDSKGNRNQ